MIIPSIDIAGGRTVQLVGGRDLALEAGDPEVWLDRFSVAGEVAVVDLDGAMTSGTNRDLIRRLCQRADCRVGGGIRTYEQARDWLDAGARRIVIGTAADASLLGRLPRERTIAALDALDGDVVVDGWRQKTGRRVIERMLELRDHVGGFLVTFVEREGRMQGIDPIAIGPLVEAAGDARVTIAGGVTTADDVATLDRLGADAQVGMALYTGRLALADAIAAPLQSDRPDGLFATVVTDERGVALGLAWSSRESLRRAIDEQRGIYHSRARGIWVKGESSGATQELLQVALDCDRDVIRFTVRQGGPGFCHAGTTTCWGPATGMQALEQTLASRRATPVAGSYTQRLWNDPGLLASKLVEEAGEVATAGSREAVVSEVADLVYFALVRLHGAGATMADVDRVLARRGLSVTRRPGDAKATDPPAATGFRGLRRVAPGALPARVPSAIDDSTTHAVRDIVRRVRTGGDAVLQEYAARFDGWSCDTPMIHGPGELRAAEGSLDADTHQLLMNAAARIRTFAMAQRTSLRDLSTAVEGGTAGHHVIAVQRAGCYAPAGRFPLPSSLLMTVVTARAAGVAEVWVATPSPSPLMLAAAAIAGATGVISAGGAHAIAALAYGTETIMPCDVVVGPGNRWVTAAKQCVAGDVAIDFLAGPSELVVVADDDADPAEVASDLLAQAEHDEDALPIVVASSEAVLDAIDRELARQLDSLPSNATATVALASGFAVRCDSEADIVRVIDDIAPEHLQLSVRDPWSLARRVAHAGAVFYGTRSAEVFGDYGAGPNHVLPTGRAARHTGGLSVVHFLRVRTWLDIEPTEDMISGTAAFARLVGLEAHARAAERRGKATAETA